MNNPDIQNCDNFFVFSEIEFAGGVVDPGILNPMSGSTGEQMVMKMGGEVTQAYGGATVTESPNGDCYLLAQPDADFNGLVDSGRVRPIAQKASDALDGESLRGMAIPSHQSRICIVL